MQHADTTMAACGAPSARLPVSGPVSLTHCTPVTGTAPAVFWLGQKLRDAPIRVEVPVVSGLGQLPSPGDRPAV